jgi:hypothetical protein
MVAPIEVGFNAQYMLDLLKVIYEDQVTQGIKISAPTGGPRA